MTRESPLASAKFAGQRVVLVESAARETRDFAMSGHVPDRHAA
jgi:hypothetical protein